MSDHYDYGYCDYCDTYHDDVNAAHNMLEPRQPTLEELDEILREQQYAVTDTSPMADAKPAGPLELPRHREEAPASATAKSKAPVVRRTLWDETTTRSQLGEEGYAWFVERAERNLPKCPQCNGSGSVMMPDPIGLRRGLLVTTACPVCSTYVENLTGFTKMYFEVVPPAYRRFTFRTLQPYPASPVPTERQEGVIAALKANPDKSYAFFAPAGAGKTVFATALFSEMLYRQYTRPHLRWKWFPVRRISIKKMLDQHADYAIRRNDPDWTDLDRTLNAPDVTADKIRAVTQTGEEYRLFLEDMNGGDLTVTSRAILFEVVNTLYENEGQLVITSNLTPAEFKRQYGEDLFWRIAKHCTVIDLFSEKQTN